MQSKKKDFIEHVRDFNGEKIENVAKLLGIKAATLINYASRYGNRRLSIKNGCLNVHEEWGESRTYHNDGNIIDVISADEAIRSYEEAEIVRRIKKEGTIRCERLG